MGRLLGDRATRRARGRGVMLGAAASTGELVQEVAALREQQERTNELLQRIAAAVERGGQPPSWVGVPVRQQQPPQQGGPRHGG